MLPVEESKVRFVSELYVIERIPDGGPVGGARKLTTEFVTKLLPMLISPCVSVISMLLPSIFKGTSELPNWLATKLTSLPLIRLLTGGRGEGLLSPIGSVASMAPTTVMSTCASAAIKPV